MGDESVSLNHLQDPVFALVALGIGLQWFLSRCHEERALLPQGTQPTSTRVKHANTHKTATTTTTLSMTNMLRITTVTYNVRVPPIVHKIHSHTMSSCRLLWIRNISHHHPSCFSIGHPSAGCPSSNSPPCRGRRLRSTKRHITEKYQTIMIYFRCVQGV